MFFDKNNWQGPVTIENVTRVGLAIYEKLIMGSFTFIKMDPFSVFPMISYNLKFKPDKEDVKNFHSWETENEAGFSITDTSGSWGLSADNFGISPSTLVRIDEHCIQIVQFDQVGASTVWIIQPDTPKSKKSADK